MQPFKDGCPKQRLLQLPLEANRLCGTGTVLRLQYRITQSDKGTGEGGMGMGLAGERGLWDALLEAPPARLFSGEKRAGNQTNGGKR